MSSSRGAAAFENSAQTYDAWFHTALGRYVDRLEHAAFVRLLGDLCLPSPFHTGHLAEQLDVQRWLAQRVTYVLRKTCAIRAVGKKGNAVLYLRNGDAAAEVA